MLKNILTSEQEKFINIVKEDCLKNNVEFYLGEGVTVTVNGGECAGFFQDLPRPKLSVATGKPVTEWFEILAHEYSHLQQWKEQSVVWLNHRVFNIECADLIDLWLNKKIELTEPQLTEYIQKIIDVEKDCEERTVNLIKTLNLPIDAENYIRKANAYLFFYHGVKKHRKWSQPGRSLYSRPEVLRMMPTDFNQNYYSPCPVLAQSIEFCFTEE